jgi:hypothetical protein
MNSLRERSSQHTPQVSSKAKLQNDPFIIQVHARSDLGCVVYYCATPVRAYATAFNMILQFYLYSLGCGGSDACSCAQ